MKNFWLALGLVLYFCSTSFGQIVYDQTDAEYWQGECMFYSSEPTTAYNDATALKDDNFTKRLKAVYWNSDVHAETNAPVALEVAGDTAVADSLTEYETANDFYVDGKAKYETANAAYTDAEAAFQLGDWDTAVPKYIDAIDNYNLATGLSLCVAHFEESSRIAVEYTDSVYDYVYGMNTSFYDSYWNGTDHMPLFNSNNTYITSVQNYISDDCGVLIAAYLAEFGSDAYYQAVIAPGIANAQTRLNEAKDMKDDANDLRADILSTMDSGHTAAGGTYSQDWTNPGKAIDEFIEATEMLPDFAQQNNDVKDKVDLAYSIAFTIATDIENRLP